MFPKYGMTGHVVVQIVKPERDVRQVAVAVGRDDRGDDAAVVGDLDFHAVGVGQRVEGHLFAVDLAPRLAGDAPPAIGVASCAVASGTIGRPISMRSPGRKKRDRQDVRYGSHESGMDALIDAPP